MNAASLRDLVEHITRALVDEPDRVDVRDVSAAGGDSIVLELRVAPADLGKVIGKGGATARAIRTVLFAASTRGRARAVLNIVEE